jgi:hypothetical protein
MEDTHFIDKEPNRYEALAELHKQSIQSMNEKSVRGIVESLEQCWDLKTEDYRHARELGYRQFIHRDNFDTYGNPDPNRIDIKAIKVIREKQRRYIVDLKNRIRELNIGGSDDTTLTSRVNNVLKQLSDGYENVRRHYTAYERVTNPTVQPLLSSASDPSTIDEDAIDECSPYQKSILYTLDELYKNMYRRYKDQCCEEIKTEMGHGTRAWTPKFTIKSFIRNIAPKDDQMNNWKNFTSRGNVYRDVTDYISNCVDPQFPEIEKRRHVWSFKNGIFVGKEWIPETERYECRFYPYESKDFQNLDPTIISCKYFDQEFDDFSNVERWQDIPTPTFDKVLQYQGFEEEVCNWAYVMGGRLCYDVGDMDGWQVIPFFKGIAGSGKSTLINHVFKKFYENDDVGILSNNTERKFGLSSIMGNFMFVSPEIKSDLALEQAEFQSIVSGESVSIAVKNQTAVCMTWNIPGVLAGNEIPNWKDNSGSILRRILAWNFTKQVREADPHLDKKLDKELPHILVKCVRAYIEYARKYSDIDIWNAVPKYFKTIQKQVAMVANTLHNFLESTNITYGEKLFVPQKLFVQVFNQHCQANNLGKQKFHPDFYVGPFSSRGIEVKNETVTYKGRVYPNQPIIYGVDVVEDTVAFTDDF